MIGLPTTIAFARVIGLHTLAVMAACGWCPRARTPYPAVTHCVTCAAPVCQACLMWHFEQSHVLSLHASTSAPTDPDPTATAATAAAVSTSAASAPQPNATFVAPATNVHGTILTAGLFITGTRPTAATAAPSPAAATITSSTAHAAAAWLNHPSVAYHRQSVALDAFPQTCLKQHLYSGWVTTYPWLRLFVKNGNAYQFCVCCRIVCNGNYEHASLWLTHFWMLPL